MQVTRNFLASWFAGKASKPENPADFYLNKVLADNFMMVRPDGTRLDREQTLDSFFNKLYASEPDVLRHDNLNINTILDTGSLAVVAYEEDHVYVDESIVNAVTAIFLQNEKAPNGVSWLSVHETALTKEKH